MADQPNLAKIRVLVAKMAEPGFQRTPEEVQALLNDQGLPVPDGLAGLLTNAPHAHDYKELLDEIDEHQGPLLINKDAGEKLFTLTRFAWGTNGPHKLACPM